MRWLTDQPWLSVTAPLTAGTLARSPETLERVAAQFDVERSPRYQPKPGATYCNVFAADVTAALGCAIPHVDRGHDGLLTELTANATVDWLAGPGSVRHGWELLPDGHTAQAMADAGRVAVAIWRNTSGGPGHVAVLMPSHGAPGVWIAQAGAHNYARAPLASGFGALPVVFFGHP
jgi:hypothetical protein